MIRIKRSGKYERMLRNVYIENKGVRKLIREKTKIFERNPRDTRLDNHPLRKRLKGKWAFSITGDIRIVYEWQNKKTVRFLMIGSRKDVYVKKI